MSEIVQEFPSLPGRPPIYPWDEWTDGEIRKLFAGEDFNGQPESFRVLAHRTAKNLGLKVSTALVPDEDAIIIQFYDPEEDE